MAQVKSREKIIQRKKSDQNAAIKLRGYERAKEDWSRGCSLRALFPLRSDVGDGRLVLCWLHPSPEREKGNRSFARLLYVLLHLRRFSLSLDPLGQRGAKELSRLWRGPSLLARSLAHYFFLPFFPQRSHGGREEGKRRGAENVKTEREHKKWGSSSVSKKRERNMW